MNMAPKSRLKKKNFFFLNWDDLGVTLPQRFSHRDKTRVQMPAKIFPQLKVKC